jgi:hypothetical protein
VLYFGFAQHGAAQQPGGKAENLDLKVLLKISDLRVGFSYLDLLLFAKRSFADAQP